MNFTGKKAEKKQEKPEEPMRIRYANITYIDGTTTTIAFYDSVFGEDGISFMTGENLKFSPGKLTTGEIYVPWSVIKTIGCTEEEDE